MPHTTILRIAQQMMVTQSSSRLKMEVMAAIVVFLWLVALPFKYELKHQI